MSTPPRAAEEQIGRGNLLQRLATTFGIDLRLAALVVVMVLIWLGFNVLTDGLFLSPRNLWNLSVQSSVVGVMAVGMVFIIVARHIDLSVGSVLGFTAMVMAVIQVQVFPIGASWNWAVTILVGLTVGALIGLFHGVIIAYLEVPAFIVTLGGLLIWRGGAWLMTRGRTVAPLDDTYQIFGGGIDGSIGALWSWILGILAIVVIIYLTLSARSRRSRYGFPVKAWWAELLILALAVAAVVVFVSTMNAYDRPRTDIPRGIAVPVLIVLTVTIVMAIVARFTRFGRYVFAMGGNPEAARLAGVDTRRVTMAIFTIMGVLCAVAAVIASARLNSGTNSLGTLDELDTIAAAVIGGTSLAGGVGTIPGAIIGTVLIASLISGMVMLDLSTATQNVIQGLVLIAAVLLDVLYQRRRSG
jgi:D-xylose transport system permease protein